MTNEQTLLLLNAMDRYKAKKAAGYKRLINKIYNLAIYIIKALK